MPKRRRFGIGDGGIIFDDGPTAGSRLRRTGKNILTKARESFRRNRGKILATTLAAGVLGAVGRNAVVGSHNARVVAEELGRSQVAEARTWGDVLKRRAFYIGKFDTSVKRAQHLNPEAMNAITKIAREAFGKKPNEPLTKSELARALRTIYQNVPADARQTNERMRKLEQTQEIADREGWRESEIERLGNVIWMTHAFSEWRAKIRDPQTRAAVDAFLQP